MTETPASAETAISGAGLRELDFFFLQTLSHLGFFFQTLDKSVCRNALDAGMSEMASCLLKPASTKHDVVLLPLASGYLDVLHRCFELVILIQLERSNVDMSKMVAYSLHSALWVFYHKSMGMLKNTIYSLYRLCLGCLQMV